jgi:hypothetical protein
MVLCAAPACNTVPAEKFQNCERDRLAGQERIDELERTLASQEATIRSLQSQINSLHGIQGNPADVLIVPQRIELASMSGCYDTDGEVGDDGVVLYIQPIDADGSVIKAPGEVTVDLLDPLNPPGRVEFASYHFDWPHLRPMWYGRLWTNHYSVKCPWPQGHLPAHDEIIVHVIFTELLTGKSMTATTTCRITFPPGRGPATPGATTRPARVPSP